MRARVRVGERVMVMGGARAGWYGRVRKLLGKGQASVEFLTGDGVVAVAVLVRAPVVR